MRGAQRLQCSCGGFFVPAYERDMFEKMVKLFTCDCGRQRKVTLDGDHYKIEEMQNGTVVETRHGIYPEKGRRRIWRRNRPHYTLSKKVTAL